MPAVRSGSKELAALAARLKATGDRELRLQMLRTLRGTAQPLVADVRAAAFNQLPQSGGLNERVAMSPIKVQVRTSPRTAAVRIVTLQHDTRPTNFGEVRHPVFGHMDRWVAQQIPNARGWFTDTLKAAGPKVTGELLASMAVISRRLTRGYGV